MKNLKKEFPLTAQYTYLNTPSSGLLTETVLDFRTDHDLDFLVMGSLLKDKQDNFMDGVRESVGRFFNCSPGLVALLPNFSYGFNILVEGLSPDSKVLLLEGDYPSVNRPVINRGFEVCYAKIDADLEKNILEMVEKEKPDVLALSLVQYISGILIDLEFIKELKSRFPDLLILADGTQFCGMEAFDFENSGIDALGASAYKWMHAGYGNGFFLFREGVSERISPKSAGSSSDSGRYKEGGGTLIGKLEPGHLDTLSLGSLQAAIRLIDKTGMDKIEAQVQNLKRLAKEALTEKGLLKQKVTDRKNHSSIFNIKGDQKLLEKLLGQQILCTRRGDGIRIGFHYFNTEEDLQKLLKVI